MKGRNSLFGGKMRFASGNISFMPKSGKNLNLPNSSQIDLILILTACMM